MVYQKPVEIACPEVQGRQIGNLVPRAAPCEETLKAEEKSGKSLEEKKSKQKIDSRKMNKTRQKPRTKEGGKKLEPGYSAEGPRNPGLSCPPPQ
jgi:hypothetical protein